MKYRTGLILTLLLCCSLPSAQAKDRLKLQTTIIKGNKEMPQIVYIVPWKDMQAHTQKEQTLVLHSLFGDLFNPVHVAATLSPQSSKPRAAHTMSPPVRASTR